MLKGFRHRTRRLVALGLLAGILASCAIPIPEDPIVGTWKGGEGTGSDQDVAEFSADGTCKLSRGGARQACAWAREADGKLSIRYGAGQPTSAVHGEIGGDRLWFLRGNHAESSWVRKGSELDANLMDYTKGEKLIQAGDYEHGMAALKAAADQGLDDAQNNLAWVYATAKDPRFRDGKAAVGYAQKAVAQADDYQYLDTLAAALARDGQFAAAVKTQTEALALLEKDRDYPAAYREKAVASFRGRLARFQQGQPYTEP